MKIDKSFIMFILIIFIISWVQMCEKDVTNPDENDLELIDYDGNIYNTIQIGEQIWMAENLKVTHYQNGDTILNERGDWYDLLYGSYYNYYDTTDLKLYGRLYNWYAVNDDRNIAPLGWHVPTDEDWKKLEMYIGLSKSESDSIKYRGDNEGIKLKSSSGWDDSGNGTDDYHFSALPGGYCMDGNGVFCEGDIGFFWTSTEYDSSFVWLRTLESNHSEIYRYYGWKHCGYSIRLVKD